LIVAIENQLGLKYFAGAPEDHGGQTYKGVMDLYTADSAVTFGRRELVGRLEKSGFAHCSFLYPLPDYKLPRIILHEAAFQEPLDFLGLLQGADQSSDCGSRLFAEELTWPVLVRNGLAPDLMNSFLVIASKYATPRLDAADRVDMYTSARCRAFAKATHIRRERSGLVVRRERLYGESEPLRGKYSQILEDEPCLAGELYVNELVRIVNRPGWTAEDIADWAKPWLELLVSAATGQNRHGTSTAPHTDELQLPGRFVDCTPFNVVKSPDDTLHPFDLEYAANKPVPFSFVAFRGLYISLAKRSTVAKSKSSRRIAKLIREVMMLAGLPLSARQCRDAVAREGEFQQIVCASLRPPISEAWAKMSMLLKRLSMRPATRPTVAGRVLRRLKRVLRNVLRRASLIGKSRLGG